MDQPPYTGRRWCLIACFGLAALLIVWRVFYLQILNKDFLIHHGDARSVRVIAIPAHRGMITDRNNEPLAISTPVASIWAVPGKVLDGAKDIGALARMLGMSKEALYQHLVDRKHREFVYLKRQVEPKLAQRIKDLEMPGIHIQKEYKRYYPAGEMASHLIGFTNVDDKGQEGVELAYDEWLQGVPGAKRVLKDRLGHVVKDIESITPADPGKPLSLSIDQRLQYLAYRELKSAVIHHKAKSGVVLLLDANTAEVLALAVQPSFNPNNRADLKSDHYRNRALTDVFEPGSTIKPFTIAAALISGLYKPQTVIKTQPGYLKIGGHTIRDINNYGDLSVSDVIKKSSNVGTTKMAMSLGPQRLWRLHHDVGFGNPTASGYPGEATGLLNHYRDWSELELATVSYGYGISVTALQLGQAYSVLASGGLLHPITFQKLTTRPSATLAVRVIPEPVVNEINNMMVSVVESGGSGSLAAINEYHVAGKTGTVHKTAAKGYAEDRYLALFAGFAPATKPELALIVLIDEPQSGQYFGGQVAAPVFAKVMEGALRIRNIPPDNLNNIQQRTRLVNNIGAGM